MCVLSMKVPMGKKSGNLSNDPRIYTYIYIYISVYIYLKVRIQRERERERERERRGETINPENTCGRVCIHVSLCIYVNVIRRNTYKHTQTLKVYIYIYIYGMLLCIQKRRKTSPEARCLHGQLTSIGYSQTQILEGKWSHLFEKNFHN